MNYYLTGISEYMEQIRIDGKRVYDYIRTDKIILVEDFVPEYRLEKICSNAGEVQRWYLAHKEAQYV